MNYFRYTTAAERYATSRPFFHPLAVNRIREHCCEDTQIGGALDIGCGTGQSAMALLEVANVIFGLDNSAEMLSQAVHHERVFYVQARAEEMPFPNASFGLLTVALAFHWFDRGQFMLEARRVLKPGGWLVIYTSGFSCRMVGNDEYEVWNREHYVKRYPQPPRNNQPLTDSDALAYGFEPSGEDEFLYEMEFTPENLVGYLLTQTNVIAAVESGKEDLQSVAGWLLSSIQPLFTNRLERFPFSCQIKFLKSRPKG